MVGELTVNSQEDKANEPSAEANPKGIVSSSPGLRARELPWEIGQSTSQPERGCGRARYRRTEPAGCPDVVYRGWGWLVPTRWTQGSSFLSTLGLFAESLRDSCNSPSRMWVMMTPQEGENHRQSFGHADAPRFRSFQLA